MKVLFTIAYIQYTIYNRSAALSVQKVSVGKVTESGFQAIKVSGDVEK